MKLSYKLTLAFLLVSTIAIGLAALFVWITTSTQFDRYVVDQRQAEFVAAVTAYYEANGSWRGVDQELRSQGLLPPVAQPGSPSPDPQPFALVNQAREVVVPGGDYQRGEKVREGTLAKGLPIEIDGVLVGTVLTTGPAPARNTIEQKYLSSVNRSLLVAALGGAALALLLGVFLARALTRPVRDLTAATRLVARGKLDQNVPVHSSDELGELAGAFNQMSADLARLDQSRRQMTADIAHDLRNPLTVIGGYLESLQDGRFKATPGRIETMQVEVRHLLHLVEDLRTLSLADAGELVLRRELLDPGQLLARVVTAYRPQAEKQKIALITEVEPGLPEFSLDPARMEGVLGNLLANALRYTPPGGEIRLSAAQDQGGLVLGIADTGTGIAPGILPHIFERSYRGDPSRSGDGSGLGLAIVKSIVELHGGSIQVESDGTGTRFSIHISE